jgi:dynactin complex subunit
MDDKIKKKYLKYKTKYLAHGGSTDGIITNFNNDYTKESRDKENLMIMEKLIGFTRELTNDIDKINIEIDKLNTQITNIQDKHTNSEQLKELTKKVEDLKKLRTKNINDLAFVKSELEKFKYRTGFRYTPYISERLDNLLNRLKLFQR